MVVEKPRVIRRMLPVDTPRVKGQVKWYDPKKGFGFVVDDATATDVFVHFRSIRDKHDLVAGQRIEFLVGPGKNGRKNQALDVTVDEEAGNRLSPNEEAIKVVQRVIAGLEQVVALLGSGR